MERGLTFAQKRKKYNFPFLMSVCVRSRKKKLSFEISAVQDETIYTMGGGGGGVV